MTHQTDHENTADKAAVTPPPALTTEGRLRARVQTLEEDAERNQGLAKVGARCMREGHQGLIESGRATVEGHRFALSVKLGLGTDATWDAIHERVKELRRDSAEAAAVSAAVAPPTNRAAPFGSPDCTCVPFTRKEGMPRACGPDDTVDDISGWETGRDCPHHAPVASPTDPTHGLSVPHADALWDAVAIPGPHTPTYPEQHERVCRAVRDILDELTPARDEVADWDDLVREADRLRRDGAALHARAEEIDNQLTALRQQITEPTDRAAVLRAEADRIDATRADFPIAVQNGITWATAEMRRHAAEMRRMADETATETPDAERLERGRAQLLEAMSAVSEDRTCSGWASDWARTLHAEGGIWETLGRAVGWPTGNYDQWVWVSWDEAAALYAAGARQDGAQS